MTTTAVCQLSRNVRMNRCAVGARHGVDSLRPFALQRSSNARSSCASAIHEHPPPSPTAHERMAWRRPKNKNIGTLDPSVTSRINLRGCAVPGAPRWQHCTHYSSPDPNTLPHSVYTSTPRRGDIRTTCQSSAERAVDCKACNGEPYPVHSVPVPAAVPYNSAANIPSRRSDRTFGSGACV